jgi:hypothetical protein
VGNTPPGNTTIASRKLQEAIAGKRVFVGANRTIDYEDVVSEIGLDASGREGDLMRTPGTKLKPREISYRIENPVIEIRDPEARPGGVWPDEGYGRAMEGLWMGTGAGQ